MEIVIRAREPQDAAAYQRLYSHPDVYPWTLQLPFPSVALWEKKFARMDAEGFVAFVAEIDGVLAGELTLFVDSKPRTRHCISFGLGVHPDFAGRGVGERLIRTAMELEVFHDNERALRLYQRLGFEREGMKRQAALRDGQLRDVVMMAKLLNDA